MPRPTTPDVSVVVIVYNDEERLPRAVESVLEQTLDNLEVLVVDDASTDGSFAVAQRLAADHPDKVRAIRLAENSGGCSRPRNEGIAQARGTYVMFLDSDDVLERHACKNMLVAAEETNSDLVSGLCVRVQLSGRGKVTPWYPALYRSRVTYESLADNPDLLFDTLSTNKCYRRSFLMDSDLRFPEGVHYEDLLFSAHAYVAASRITLIPNTVYHWNVNEKEGERSISNRRDEIRNFVDRLTVHRGIDRLLAEHGTPELVLQKQVKFLKHDLVLYLWHLPFADDEYRVEIMALAREYLAGFSDEAFREVTREHAIAAYLLVQDDWANLEPAIDHLLNRRKLTTPLPQVDGRRYWCTEHLDDPLGREILDVTDQGWHLKTLAQQWLGNTLTSYGYSGGMLRLGGRIVNPAGAITKSTAMTAHLEFSPRRKRLGRVVSVPVDVLRHAGDHVVWESAVDVTKAVHPVGLIDKVWDIRLRLKADNQVTRTRIFAPMLADEPTPIPVRPVTGPLLADHFQAHVSAKGHLSFELVPGKPLAQRNDRLAREALRSDLGRSTVRAMRKRLKKTVALKQDKSVELRNFGYRALTKLPVRKGTVVFESHLGKEYSDSPKYIYEELRRSGLPYEVTWAYSDSTAGFPKDCRLVKRGSWAYYKALAQAEFWVDNQGFPRDATKNPGTTYIQTWHGSALKAMGFDIPAVQAGSRAEHEELQQMVDRFDYFVVRSEHDVRTLMNAYRLKAEPLRVGYPRNDALINTAQLSAEAESVRKQLGLHDGRKVVLYAPTFRQSGDGRIEPFTMPFDLERFAERFGEDHVLLIRTHYLNSFVIPDTLRDFVKDARQVQDITPLMLASDVLVTDYSSLMFDFALLDRPMVFFTYDYERYTKQDRGSYFDLAEHAPGPLAHDEAALFDRIAELADGTDHAAARRTFVDAFGEYDHGTAAKAVVARFFGSGAHA